MKPIPMIEVVAIEVGPREAPPGEIASDGAPGLPRLGAHEPPDEPGLAEQEDADDRLVRRVGDVDIVPLEEADADERDGEEPDPERGRALPDVGRGRSDRFDDRLVDIERPEDQVDPEEDRQPDDPPPDRPASGGRGKPEGEEHEREREDRLGAELRVLERLQDGIVRRLQARALPDVDPVHAVDRDPGREDRERVLVLRPVRDEMGGLGRVLGEHLVELLGDAPVGEDPDLRRAREDDHFARIAHPADLVEEADGGEHRVRVRVLGVGGPELHRGGENGVPTDDGSRDVGLAAQVIVPVDADDQPHGADTMAGTHA